MTDYKCYICNVDTTSETNLKSHIDGQKHKRQMNLQHIGPEEMKTRCSIYVRGNFIYK